MYNLEKLKQCSVFPCSKEIMNTVVETMEAAKVKNVYVRGYDYTIHENGYVNANARGLGHNFYRDLGGQWYEDTDNLPYEVWLESVQ